MNWLTSLIERLLSVFPRLYTVRPDESGCRITLGSHVRPIGPGWYIYLPILQEMAVITITTQVIDLRAQSVQMVSGEDMCIGLAVRYRIKDAVAAQLKVQDYDQSLCNVALTVCVDFLNTMPQGSVVLVRGTNMALTKLIQAKARGWGIEIQSAAITDIGSVKNIRVLADAPIIPIIGDGE